MTNLEDINSCLATKLPYPFRVATATAGGRSGGQATSSSHPAYQRRYQGKPSTPQGQTFIDNDLTKRRAVKTKGEDNLGPDNSTNIMLA
ncbi:hypothetical protein NXS19_010624 [Fusarium pseudograminearum]|uniref:Uncharacterized protein n=1 Tax=Fusarium pseudograminearum (strain CS3096) TaxID=1028729 RepID=K3UBQ6_FUSPC|nr:hypothetical protein FPSE_10961 [Fusarium pseudograminearum CS3096]EKJ68841.1 hypothetical protein FPSE_10961 [Fusarium pseudograminearum CS3096]UZP42808.1 hypothetical protein NXS19_010624 [Fusarium pseudograminearum]